MTCADQWKYVIDRLGRWVDMDNDYKTMDLEYMESVWWVFSELYKKGLVYRGYKVISYSMGCKSPISNVEAKSNYQRVSDWAINIKFMLDTGDIALVFTTTPWTLPANLAIAVNPEFNYCKITIEGEGDQVYIVGQPHLERTLGKRKFKINEIVKGDELVGVRYKPLFDYFKDYNPSKSFRIYGGDFVVTDKGTGFVHCAPAHGEEDYSLCLSHCIFEKTEIPPCPLDDDCNFTDIVTHFKSRNVKECEDDIVAYLKDNGVLYSKGKEVHDYPMCWRSDTPLIQKVCECWFIDVPKITEQLISNNKQVHWTPDFVGSNRFGEWLKNSQDWCVSRNRFWGTPIPIWGSEDNSEYVCISSVHELEQLAGLQVGSIKDIHRDSIDHIVIISPTSGKLLRRVEYIFDCWFDSGCMPYAQQHYPFAEGSEFRPADFIAEGLDQTRGWFYTLLVIGTALFGVSPYKNVLVNGIVLATDGEKMSKRKNNYPPVEKILNQYGADALRLYLISTPVVRAGDIKFSPQDIRDVTRRFSKMYENVFRYFKDIVGLYEQTKKCKFTIIPIDKLNETYGRELTAMDDWIMQCLNDLILSVTKLMDNYQLNGIVDKIYRFIDQLSRWYINMNKKRFKRIDSTITLDVLGNCLYYFTLICAPFAPFSTEDVYQNLREYGVPNKDYDSIHYHQIPTTSIWVSHDNLLELFEYVSDIIDIVRSIRNDRSNSSAKMPLPKIVLCHNDQSVLNTLKLIENQLKEELNIELIEYSIDVNSTVQYDLQLDVQADKKRLDGRAVGESIKYIKQLSFDEKQTIGSTQTVSRVCPVLYEELKVVKNARPGIKVKTTNRITVTYDDSINRQLLEKYTANQFYRVYQQARKDAGLLQTDQVTFQYSCTHELNDILNRYDMPAKTGGVYIEHIHVDNTLLSSTKSLELGDVIIHLIK